MAFKQIYQPDKYNIWEFEIKKNIYFSAFWFLGVVEISCSVELSITTGLVSILTHKKPVIIKNLCLEKRKFVVVNQKGKLEINESHIKENVLLKLGPERCSSVCLTKCGVHVLAFAVSMQKKSISCDKTVSMSMTKTHNRIGKVQRLR